MEEIKVEEALEEIPPNEEEKKALETARAEKSKEEFLKESKDLTNEEKKKIIDVGFRNFREGEKPIISEFVRPADYQHDLIRGTLKYDKDMRNYSNSNVIIEDNTNIIGCNFTQSKPNTIAIKGENLKFYDCNLSNCFIDHSWIIFNCNTSQSWTTEEGKVFICEHPSKITGEEKPPENIKKELK